MPEGTLTDRIDGLLSAVRGLPEPFTVNVIAISLGKRTLDANDLQALDRIVMSGKLTAHEVDHPDGTRHFEYRRTAAAAVRDS